MLFVFYCLLVTVKLNFFTSSNPSGFGEVWGHRWEQREVDETADRDKEAWRDSAGVSKGKIKAECWAEADQEPGAGIRQPAHLLPQVCWHRQPICPHKDDDRTGRSSSQPMAWRSAIWPNFHNYCAEVVG